ncbi:MAG: glutamate formimidoyltransferase [Bacilli bacterium]
MNRIVQCVPNFSEGRDLDKVEKIVSVLKDRDGFKLVSYLPDPDHNRTVVTLLGDIDAIKEALVDLVGKTTELIDLNKHSGEHKRMGALDVIPFIPLKNITMEECVEVANELGSELAQKYDLPIYMYAEAAKKDDRVKLPTIRKGEFEGFDEKIKDANWAPDYGNAKKHPTAGCTAVGARVPLIAFNINLDTADVDVAANIAKAIRFSSGGYRFVQAGPMELTERGIVQVSMNILDYRKTSIYRVFETVKFEAERYGVNVIGSEIIGSLPMEALTDCASYYLKVEGFNMDMVLENNLI